MAGTFALQWHITDECDQRCKHCYIFANGDCEGFERMTWDDMVRVAGFGVDVFAFGRYCPTSGESAMNFIWNLWNTASFLCHVRRASTITHRTAARRFSS